MITETQWGDVATGLGALLAYVAVAVVILVLGFVLTDLTTPGKLGTLICTDRNVNATIVASTNLLAVGAIVTMAIWSTHDDFAYGLVTTAVFGLVGVLLLAAVDWLVDKLTPGYLPELIVGQQFHPASVFVGVAHLVIGVVIAVSIT